MHGAPQRFSSRQSGHVRLRSFLTAVFLSAILASTGCTSLKPVADFGRNASVLAGYPAVAKDYPLSLARQQLYGQTGTSVSAANSAQRERAARRLLAAQQVLQAYGQAVGALAADDLLTYDKEIAALNKGLVAGQWVTAAQTARYATAAKVGFRFFTDGYRRAIIKHLITTYDPAVQAVTAQLVEIVDGGYLTGLTSEAAMFTQLVAGRARLSAAEQGLAGLPQLINVLANEYAQSLEVKAANARAFVAGLKKFGQGHQELAASLGQGAFKPSLEIARKTADELQKVIESFRP